MKNKKNIIFFILIFISSVFLHSQSIKDIFNNKITDSEIKQLENGETVIKNIGKPQNISLTNSNNKLVEDIHDVIYEKDPNYLAEIIKIIPKSNNEDIISKLFEAIMDIESYTEIPYFSERHQCYFNLYDSAKINYIQGTENEKKLNFTVEMEPFGTITMNGKISKTDNSLSFSMENTTKVIYENMHITCAKVGNMYSAIVLFEYGDYYILYGIGGVKGPSIFFLRDRIDISFVGRINSFCKYMFEKIDIN